MLSLRGRNNQWNGVLRPLCGVSRPHWVPMERDVSVATRASEGMTTQLLQGGQAGLPVPGRLQL